MPLRLFFVKTLRKIDYKNSTEFTFEGRVILGMRWNLLIKS